MKDGSFIPVDRATAKVVIDLSARIAQKRGGSALLMSQLRQSVKALDAVEQREVEFKRAAAHILEGFRIYYRYSHTLEAAERRFTEACDVIKKFEELVK